MYLLLRVGLYLLLGWWLSGCAGLPTARQQDALPLQAPQAATPQSRWHVTYFNHVWPKGQSPRWQLDALLAHRVIAPVLARHQQAIPLWRFHRRAARDRAGHRLRFIYYTDSQTAALIRQEIEADPLLKRLLADNWLSRVRHGGFGKASAQLSATSDPSWSAAVQRAWPHFIMGVSRTWLELIATAEQGRTRRMQDTGQLVARYARIEAEINHTWLEHGQHAFLHHLSGVYGYKPFAVRY
jgi:hypothetical protein